MASITKRATILIFCRVLNNAVMLLSPVFLTRLFNVQAYGQYQEFIVYGMLISGLIEFTINTNLIYFIPKHPDRERQGATHTALLIFAASCLGIVVVYVLRGLILAKTSYNFTAPLLAFIFFYLNCDFFESYLLGKKRTDYVLYYSTGRVVVRTAALIASAWLSRDVMTVIWTLVAVEIVKCLFVLTALRNVFTKRLDRGLFREQLRYIVPLGSSVVISQVNSQLANLFVSIKMGVERLAVYANGNRQIPIMDIIRRSVMDVLFPEMTQIGEAERLQLWRRANVVFCALVFPVYAVFFCYAHAFIETLFTAKYLAAVPLFRIYLTLMVIQCFDMGTPLRAINQNKYYIFGSILDLSVNVGMLVVLLRPLGFVTPAVSFILGETVMAVYLGSRILHFYRISLSQLFLWRKIITVIWCAVVALPALLVGIWIDLNPVVRAVSFSTLYLVAYYVAIRRFKIAEVELLAEKLSNRLRDVRARIGQ
ncbi:MAG: oligosaccharide flippase family protein [Candidatus Krumholzibacteriaceae bacterium]